jgi:hypothetical protein
MTWLGLEQGRFECKDNRLTAGITGITFPRTLKINAFQCQVSPFQRQGLMLAW